MFKKCKTLKKQTQKESQIYQLLLEQIHLNIKQMLPSSEFYLKICLTFDAEDVLHYISEA